MRLHRYTAVLLAAAAVFLIGCETKMTEETSSKCETEAVTTSAISYEQITGADAKAYMDSGSDYTILDVRRTDEYESGHIPGAICIPVETIDETIGEKLPDKSGLILVYCRSGRRSKVAAEKLVEYGYTNVKEFGGILDWEYEIVTSSDEPETNPGKDENSMTITIGQTKFTATLSDSETAKAFRAILPMTLNMTELNGNEKYYYLSESLPTDKTVPGTIHAGDLMLYGDSCIVLFYENFQSSYSYTYIGHIDDVSGLKSAVGSGSVSVRFE